VVAGDPSGNEAHEVGEELLSFFGREILRLREFDAPFCAGALD